MLTKMTLKNMTFYGYHGVYSTEKELGQQIEVDVELVGDFTKAGRNDDFDQALNYAEVYNIVKDIVEEQQFNLIESIGTAISDQIAASYDLEKIMVRVRKPHPPVGGFMDAVEFEVSREK